MNSRKDVKFIIYQALYIFVICVIAIKGADINLTEVVAKENVIPKNTKDSLVSVIDSLLALGIVPDISGTNTTSAVNPPSGGNDKGTTILNPPLPPPDSQEPVIPPTAGTDNGTIPVIQDVRLVQYRKNKVTNLNSVNMTLKFDDGSTFTVSPKSTKWITVLGQKSVKISVMDSSEVFYTVKNENPKFNFRKIAGTRKASELQKIVGYRVEIIDDFPDQLEVTITGSVKYINIQGLIYDVTLNYFSGKDAFERFAENRSEPYRINFSVTVKDKVSGQAFNQLGTFEFDEW